jgi:ketosteroid isomerase-like protein
LSDTDRFLEEMLPRQLEAEKAIHVGDVEPRTRVWSHDDPVTLFGALGPCVSGWADIRKTFEWVATQFAPVETYDFELIAAGASGDLAYTVGYERSTFPDREFEPKVVRVTHVYRRENGEWKIVHRHGDLQPPDQSATS